jgi:Asp-tRNA(Asn)/Glu-tRNA(Gln) amidotransferase A subunit family amidase
VSAAAALEAHITRIAEVNPQINALVHERFAAARAEAQAADALPPERRGPLHGVPITIKDAFDVAGLPTTCGLTSRAGRVVTHDAAAVARLRAAGAIVLGTTNTPDNCWAQETANPLHGLTRNPHDPARSVGGSTGGEAALIAAGGSPLGLGSDIAGSIRLPAAFCGIAGLRPTSGALDETGFWPPSAGRLAQLNAIGPMARQVEDLALAWDVLRGAPHQPPDPALLRGRTAAYWFDDGLTPSSAAIRAGVRAAVGRLERAGMRARAAAPPLRRMAILGWLAVCGPAERRAIAAGFGGGQPWRPLREAVRTVTGRRRIGNASLYYWLGSHYGALLAAALGIDGMRWRERLQAQLLERIGPGGVAVCPIFPTTAPPHGFSALALLTTTSYQTWVNLAGLPAVTVPVGRTRHGMPVGVQLVGAPGSEATLLAAGMAVQQSAV